MALTSMKFIPLLKSSLGFMFQPNNREFAILKSQFATSRWGGTRNIPYVFTEHGAVMAASVLNSTTAIDVSIYTVKAFVSLKEAMITNAALKKKIEAIEKKLTAHDEHIRIAFNIINQLLETSVLEKEKKDGF